MKRVACVPQGSVLQKQTLPLLLPYQCSVPFPQYMPLSCLSTLGVILYETTEGKYQILRLINSVCGIHGLRGAFLFAVGNAFFLSHLPPWRTIQHSPSALQYHRNNDDMSVSIGTLTKLGLHYHRRHQLYRPMQFPDSLWKRTASRLENTEKFTPMKLPIGEKLEKAFQIDGMRAWTGRLIKW